MRRCSLGDIENQDSRKKKLGADFLLLVNAFFWGITFVIVKEAIEQVGVFFFLTQRFALAFSGLILVCLILRRPLTLKSLKQGTILGIFLFGAYAFQTLALSITTASNTAFLTGLNVVLVPIFVALIFRHLITRNMQMGVVLAGIGLYFLTTHGSWTIDKGDLLGISCAVCIALHIIFTGTYARMSDVYWLTAIQFGVIAMFSALIATFSGYKIFVWHSEIIWALVICVLFASIFAFLVQTSMQRFTSSTHTALIFCMEPVFAALYAYWAINERLGSTALVGALLILAGMILSEISPSVSLLRTVVSSSPPLKRL